MIDFQEIYCQPGEDQTVVATLPKGWTYADDSQIEKIPQTIHAYKPENAEDWDKVKVYPGDDVHVNIIHIHRTVTADKPLSTGSKTVTGKDINGTHTEDLHKTVTRTVNITDPHTKKTTTTTQVSHLTREADVDEVTGDVTYGTWTTDDKDWIAVDVPGVAGYTPSQASVGKTTVDGDTKDATIDITYQANAQSMNIVYKDAKGNVIKTDKVSGKTDQTVDTKASLPAGWKIADSSTVKNVPATITFKGASTPDIVITVAHGTRDVQSTDPIKDGEKTPTGKVINGGHASDLSQTITRTITVHTPNVDTPTVITQTAHLTRTGHVDLVTGDVTYDAWSTDNTDWPEYDVPAVTGYNASQNKVYAVDVKDGQKDVTIDITYIGEDSNVIIKYVDADEPISHSDINILQQMSPDSVPSKIGQTGSYTVSQMNDYLSDNDLSPYYQLDPNQQDISYTVKANDATVLTIELHHKKVTVSSSDPKTTNDMIDDENNYPQGVAKADLNKTVTRTIRVTDPQGKITTKMQTASFSRSATVDMAKLITDEPCVTYSSWSPKAISWEGFTTPAIEGYTPTPAKVDAITVNGDTKSTTINISYTANKQSMNIIYKDAQGNTIKTDTVNGATNLTVDTKSTLPAGWKITDISKFKSVPATITFKVAPTPDVVITVDHAHRTVTPDKPVQPGEKTPDGKNPIDGGHEDDLNQTITRTVNITDPHTKKTTTTVQTAHITRTGDLDEVTGHVTYGDWSTDATSWAAVNVPVVTGYTPNIKSVGNVIVKDGQKNVTLDITYSANDGTQTINFVDDSGAIIGHQTISGKTDEDVKVTPQLPAGWVLSNDSGMPTDVTIKTTDTPISVHVKHGQRNVTPGKPVQPG